MAVLTTTIVGTLVGGISSAIPMVFDYFSRRDKLRFERDMAQLKMEQARYEAEHEIRVVEATADANEGDSLRRHDSSLDGEGFIGALRASVRPVITYLFFFTFLTVKIISIMVFVKTSGQGDWLGNTMAWADIYPLIWDENSRAIFGAIIGFWFGSRTMERLRGRNA